jgi:predicted nucleic acid-binding protein
MSKLSISELVQVLSQLDEAERLELCDALVDDPRLRDLLETIDDYLYLETDTLPPVNLQSNRNLN